MNQSLVEHCFGLLNVSISIIHPSSLPVIDYKQELLIIDDREEGKDEMRIKMDVSLKVIQQVSK